MGRPSRSHIRASYRRFTETGCTGTQFRPSHTAPVYIVDPIMLPCPPFGATP
jgi:hypothetical protein